MNTVVLRAHRSLSRSNKLLPFIGKFTDTPATTIFQSFDSNQICSRNFHSTQRAPMPVRRRRRTSRQNEAEDSEGTFDNPWKHEPVLDTFRFCHEANSLLTKLEGALTPMKPKNDTFIVTREEGEIGEILTIDLGPKEGSYRIEICELEHMFEYTSPISGKLLYVLSADTGEWVGAEDGHDFQGLLVRDLIRQCQGVPNL